ncbi:hypothetical protein SAMN04487926_111158 [Paraburkholderia steynii]|uniref:Uncharacterized protein n=1 Tax=Paraburkholderia steynii TaxID=1245441 RepID=A0A7Z7B7X3_9BURK|nr:hypothetical protein SAMN04487926_111158 [Paraburkholderia steynii]
MRSGASHGIGSMDGSTRAWVDLQELRSLYRCEDSAGWLVRADFAPCFPFNCARRDTARGHQSAASVEVTYTRVKKREVVTGTMTVDC